MRSPSPSWQVDELQALDSTVVHDLDGDAAILAPLEGERDGSPVCLDFLLVDFGLQVPRELGPSAVLTCHREKDLSRKKAPAVVIGVEHPERDPLRTARFDRPGLRVVVVETLNLDLELALVVALGELAQGNVRLPDEPEALIRGTLLLQVFGQEVGVHLDLDEGDAGPLCLLDVLRCFWVEVKRAEENEGW